MFQSLWGGMENITLTHNTDRTMFDSKAHPDHSSDGLVAHELAHQWFGNLITTRNWANIWLNEGLQPIYQGCTSPKTMVLMRVIMYD